MSPAAVGTGVIVTGMLLLLAGIGTTIAGFLRHGRLPLVAARLLLLGTAFVLVGAGIVMSTIDLGLAVALGIVLVLQGLLLLGFARAVRVSGTPPHQ
jgi:hypothetical protein